MAVRQPPAHVSLPGEGLPGQNPLIRLFLNLIFSPLPPVFLRGIRGQFCYKYEAQEKISSPITPFCSLSLIKFAPSHDLCQVKDDMNKRGWNLLSVPEWHPQT